MTANTKLEQEIKYFLGKKLIPLAVSDKQFFFKFALTPCMFD
jgi:hypothetical protein